MAPYPRVRPISRRTLILLLPFLAEGFASHYGAPSHRPLAMGEALTLPLPSLWVRQRGRANLSLEPRLSPLPPAGIHHQRRPPSR